MKIIKIQAELGKQERYILKETLRNLSVQAADKGNEYSKAFLENLKYYERYTHRRLARKLIFG